MWLTKKLKETGETAAPQCGTVTQGGVNPRVVAGQEYLEARGVFPYGMYATVPAGARAVVWDGLCLGVMDPAGEPLAEGEVCLFSRGGACIVLKNTGEVIINGQVFAKKEE